MSFSTAESSAKQILMTLPAGAGGIFLPLLLREVILKDLNSCVGSAGY